MRRAACLLSLGGAALGLSEDYVRNNGPLLWANFKQQHRKSYSEAEEARRYGIFMANMQQASQLEKENPRATFGASKFADLTADEFKPYHNLRVKEKPSPPSTFTDAQIRAALASSVDWRSKGAVTQVKDQKQCGSCWAFSSTGGIEGQWFLAGNKLTSVSEQELVSCDKVDDGCNGGLMDNAYEWLVSKKSGEIVTEASYPYTSGSGSSGSCKSLSGKAIGGKISGHTDIAHKEADMAAYVLSSGPLPIAVDAQSHWQTYTSGIVSNCNGKQLDHGVLAVGYTSEYWIVKNSWGSSWGESGYIRLAYGSNQCGLNKSPTAAIAAGAANATVARAQDTATYKCSVCAHVYDPAADGDGKAFEDLPDTWVCPVCGAPKSAYGPSVAKADTTYTCSVCAHVYDAAADGGGASFESLPDTWTCPVCGAPKSAYTASVAKADTTYTCSVCSHVYDPAKDGGGAAFESLPDTWVCPVCGAPKSAYTPSVSKAGKITWSHH